MQRTRTTRGRGSPGRKDPAREDPIPVGPAHGGPIDGAAAAVEAFRTHFHRPPEIVVRAPGRVALLGAHVDYSDGWVMPAAIERAVWLAASPNPNSLDLRALDLGEGTRLDLDSLPPPIPDRQGVGDLRWSDYPAGVAWALRRERPSLPGLDVVFGGDLPRGAGVSSSAAVEMAFVLAWRTLADLDLDLLSCARLGQRVENGYLGLGSGLMDPFASLHGRRGHLVLLDCRSCRHELLPLPEDAVIVVADSGIRRRLVASGFNDRRAQCRRAVELLRPHLAETGRDAKALRDVTPRDLELHGHLLEPELLKRARHAVEEMGRVRAAADALRGGDLAAFGEAMNRSHASSRDLYEVSVPELDALCEAATSVDGCWGARLMGGGFGGCVAILARASAQDEVRGRVADAFEGDFGRRPEMFVTRPADGASVIAP
ncbi:MAG: galactokinase [Acidobacteriota bacterium]